MPKMEERALLGRRGASNVSAVFVASLPFQGSYAADEALIPRPRRARRASPFVHGHLHGYSGNPARGCEEF